MAYGSYQLLQIDVKGGIATAIVDAPPINVADSRFKLTF